MTAQPRKQSPRITRPQPSRGKRPQQATDKFASLTADLLARDEATIITREDVRSYDHAEAKASRAETQKIAVTFRMQQQEFFRLRKGADKIGVKPRDIVHRAIKNCLDAYGVSPAGKPAVAEKRKNAAAAEKAPSHQRRAGEKPRAAIPQEAARPADGVVLAMKPKAAAPDGRRLAPSGRSRKAPRRAP
ncbi:MAG: hypothetical protein AAGJ87_06770 [Pseudomonadota bacterium]